MASTLNVTRTVLHILTAVFFIVGITFCLAAVLTSAWQTYHSTAGGISEIYQYGLWFDYFYSSSNFGIYPNMWPSMQMAWGQNGFGNMPGPQVHSFQPEWQWRYKFGSSVMGDDWRRWRPYQYNTLALMGTACFFAFVSMCIMYAGPCSAAAATVGAILGIFPIIFAGSGVVLFYTYSILPDNNHVYRNTWLVYLDVGYSFYLAIAGTIIFALAFVVAIGAAVSDGILARKKRPQPVVVSRAYSVENLHPYWRTEKPLHVLTDDPYDYNTQV